MMADRFANLLVLEVRPLKLLEQLLECTVFEAHLNVAALLLHELIYEFAGVLALISGTVFLHLLFGQSKLKIKTKSAM